MYPKIYQFSPGVVFRDEFWTQCSSWFYLWPLQFFSSWSFSNIRIERMYQNIAVLVFRVFLAQGQTRNWLSWSFIQPKILIEVSKIQFLWGDKSYSWLTQKFLFCKKTYFFAPKLKMLRIEFRFDRKMHPSMESHPSILLLIHCGERPKN